MIIKATQKYTRQAPRKVRLVANSLKKMTVGQAIQQLGVIERKASIVVLKVLRQAIANATNNHGLGLQDLKIRSIQIQNGPYYKRFRAASRGRAHSIYKKTSHIVVELETIVQEKAAVVTKAQPEKKLEVETKTAAVKPVAKKSSKSKVAKPKAIPAEDTQKVSSEDKKE